VPAAADVAKKNCAPLQDLPGHLSQLAAHGVRIAAVWQSLVQARDRYGEALDTIMAASTCKLFMGPVTDETTRRYIDGLLGQLAVEVDDHSALGSKASAQELQQLDRSRALVIAGELPPAIVRLDPYWRVRDFRGLDAA
jgi:type IV secretory pathway TraG/TraD family ATPase VirD4